MLLPYMAGCSIHKFISLSALQAVLRIEGANIIPFTANNLNIFVTAVVTQLPNVTAKDIVISQVYNPVSTAQSALKTRYV